MSKRKTTKEFIEEARKVQPKYDYSKVNYVNSQTKVTIRCPKHGDFLIKPNDLLSEHGCRECGKEKNAKAHRKTTEEFIARVKQFHPEYDYSKVNYVDKNTKVWIGCPKHGYVDIPPQSILHGHGCRYCGQDLTHKDQRKTTKEFVKKAKLLYPKYDYSKVNYVNNKTNVLIGCPKHGYFPIRPNNILHGHGCKDCGFESMKQKRTKSTERFVTEAKLLYPGYDYSKVNYINHRTNVLIDCPKHGEFYITPNELLNGHGCKYCGIESRTQKRTKSTEKFILEAKKIYPEYDYSKVNYIRDKTKVLIGCTKHGYFRTTPNSLLRGSGCPICSESKGEKTVRNWFEKHNINYKRQHRFAELGQYSYDFYIPDFNLLIEYNGEQHYKKCPYFHRKPNSFECQLKRDELKKDYAEKNGYKLLVIPYTEFNNIESILEKNILSSQK